MELDAASISYSRSGCLIMHVNKVHHVTTINRVAKDLGETEDWLSDVANEMDIEDGVIWVYGVGEDGVMAFTDFGIENLVDLIKCTKNAHCSTAGTATNRLSAAYAGWIRHREFCTGIGARAVHRLAADTGCSDPSISIRFISPLRARQLCTWCAPCSRCCDPNPLSAESAPVAEIATAIVNEPQQVINLSNVAVCWEAS